MDERERLLREIFGDKGVDEIPKRPRNTRPLFPLRQIWPDVVDQLQALLIAKGETALAATVQSLEVYDRCRCGADHCATVYVEPPPEGAYGPGHRNVVFWDRGRINLDTL
jgi:hypothetical protein